ncbi:MAG: hypothetical protein ACD_75C02014G0001 [uncultured bacterium]|nr:MAG: hypothetical protein ACD_75C02014G0001 [uncultured bacterium]
MRETCGKHAFVALPKSGKMTKGTKERYFIQLSTGELSE